MSVKLDLMQIQIRVKNGITFGPHMEWICYQRSDDQNGVCVHDHHIFLQSSLNLIVHCTRAGLLSIVINTNPIRFLKIYGLHFVKFMW